VSLRLLRLAGAPTKTIKQIVTDYICATPLLLRGKGSLPFVRLARAEVNLHRFFWRAKVEAIHWNFMKLKDAVEQNSLIVHELLVGRP